MALLDSQVEIRLIDIAWKEALAQSQTVGQMLKGFDGIYKTLAKSVLEGREEAKRDEINF